MRSGSFRRWLGAVAAIALSSLSSQAQFIFTHIGGGSTGSIVTNDLATGNYTMDGGGGDIWSCGDDFDFSHYTVTGDFDVSVRIDSIEATARWAKGGLMIRDAMVPTARMAFIRGTPAGPAGGTCGDGVNDVHMSYRTGITACNQGEHEDGFATPNYPNCWLRLVRTNTTVSSLYSSDGVNWSFIASQNTATWEGGALPNSIELGFAVSHHGCASDPICTVQFRDFSAATAAKITTQPANKLVSAGQSANFSVGVASGFDGMLAYQWVQNGTPIPGAVGSTYTKVNPTLAENGSTFSVIVSNKASKAITVSSNATLTVIAAPQIVSVGTKGDTSGVYVAYSRLMDGTTVLDPNNYSIDGGVTISGAAFFGTTTNVVRLQVSGLTFGTSYNLTVTNVHDYQGNDISPDPATASFTHGANMAGPRGLVFRRYDNIGGGNINNNLLPNPNFPCNPSRTNDSIPNMEYSTDPTPINSTDTFIENYGSWMYGMFSPAVSGNYQFGTSSDDNSQLYLSTDASPANKVLLASENDWNGFRDYTGRTATRYLEAGRTYYMEVLHTDGCCGDHVTVAMAPPGAPNLITNGQGPIDATNFVAQYSYGCPPQSFFANLGPISLIRQATNTTAIESTSYALSVDVDGSGPHFFQWYKNGTAIPGATKSTLTRTAVTNDNSATFFVVANNDFSSVTSSVVTLTVIPSPQLVGASTLGDVNGVYVKFSKPMNNTALNTANYSINNGVTVSSAVFVTAAHDAVRLQVSTLGNGSYTLTVQNVQDSDGNPLNPSPASTGFSSFNGTFTANFSSMPSGGAVYGNASVVNGVLQLTANQNSLNGSFVLNDFLNGAAFQGFEVSWKATIGFGSSTPADGYSFCVATDLPNGTWTEEGTGNGLNISFDTYDNGGGEAPAIDVRVNGATLQHVSYQAANNVSNSPVIVTLLADGRLNLVYNGSILVTNLQTGYRPAPGSRWGFAGRTGGLNQYNVIDDLAIKVYNPGPITLVSQPGSQTVNELTVMNWSVTADGSLPYAYQWYRNGTPIAGATNRNYSFQAMRTDNNVQFSATISNLFSGVATTNWTLTVISDTTAPTVASRAKGNQSRHHAMLTYSEPIDFASATNLANYAITNSAGAPLAIFAAQAISPTNVVLTTDLQAEGASYTIVINNVTDRAGVPNPIGANSTATFRGFVFTPGFALMEVYNTSSGNAVSLLRNSPGYPWLPRESYYIFDANSRDAYPDDSHENYGARISGLFIPPATQNYVVYVSNDDDGEVWASIDDNPANLQQVITSPGCCAAFSAHASGPLPLSAGNRYYYELLYKEGTGGDYAALSLDPNATVPGANTTNVVGLVGGSLIGIYADPNNTTITLTQAPQNTLSVPNQYAVFTVGATNSARMSQIYSWQRWDANASVFTNIPGAFGPTNRTLIVGPLTLADDTAVFRAIVYSPGASASATATLTVTNDTVAPFIVSARANATFKQVLVTFSEPMNTNDNAGLREPLNYTLEDGVHFFCFSSVQQLSPTNVLLTLDSGSCEPSMLENTDYTLTVYSVSDANGNPIDTSNNTASFRSLITSRGFAKYEFYLNISGTTIPLLTGNPAYPNSPNVSYYTNTLEWPQTNPDLNNYGLRMSGFFVPPTSGNYTFYLKNDDDAQFSLSTDENPANLTVVRSIACCNGGFAGAAVVNGLVAGNRYYFEALVKEGGGGDYLTVGVQAPGASGPVPINGAYLSYPLPTNGAPNIGIAQNPQNRTVEQNHTATFTVLATNAGSAGAGYVWEANSGSGWVEVGSGASYTTPRATLAMNGWQYRARAYAPGAVAISTPATLTVFADTNPAVALLAHGVYNNNAVVVLFDDLIESTSAQTVGNYTLLDSNGAPLIITSATLGADSMSVTLALDGTTPTAYGATYTVAVSNVIDQIGQSVAGTVLPFQAWTLSRGAALFEAYLNVGGGTAVNLLTGHADYPNNPQVRRHVNAMDSRPAFPDDSHENYGARISGYVVPPITANYIFYLKSDDASQLWLSTDASPANKVLLTEETGCCGNFSGHASAQKSLVAGQPYYIELLYKEGGGGDYGQAAAKLAADPTNPDSLAPFSGSFLWSLADPMGTSITVTQQPASSTVAQWNVASFTVGGFGTNLYGDAGVVYQWQRSTDAGATWADIPGEIGRTYNTPQVDNSYNGSQYRALLIIPGRTTPTAAATLTVTPDLTAPKVLYAVRPAGYPSTVRVVFSEVLGTGAANIGNYAINGINVTNATFSADTVILSTDAPLADGGDYTLTVNNTPDRAGNPVTPNSQCAIVIATAPALVGNALVMEAEDYDTADALNGHAWSFSNAPFGAGNFSGSGYMVATPNINSGNVGNNDNANGPRLNYTVNFPSAGTWYIWLRGNGANSSDNSCHVGIDGTMSSTAYAVGNAGPPPGWGDSVWHWVHDQSGSESPVASLTVNTAGVHTVTIWMREDGVMVDKILLTSDSAYTFADRSVVGPSSSGSHIAPPHVNSVASGNNLTIQWATPGRLQSADAVTGPWSDVPGTSPVSIVTTNGPQKFFRVVR